MCVFFFFKNTGMVIMYHMYYMYVRTKKEEENSLRRYTRDSIFFFTRPSILAMITFKTQIYFECPTNRKMYLCSKSDSSLHRHLPAPDWAVRLLLLDDYNFPE